MSELTGVVARILGGWQGACRGSKLCTREVAFECVDCGRPLCAQHEVWTACGAMGTHYHRRTEEEPRQRVRSSPQGDGSVYVTTMEMRRKRGSCSRRGPARDEVKRARVLEMLRAQARVEDIHRETGASGTMIAAVRKEHGITYRNTARKVTPEMIERMRDLASEGKSPKEIGDALGVSRQLAGRLTMDAPGRVRGRRLSPAREVVARLWSSPLTLREIGMEAGGINPSRVSELARLLGLPGRLVRKTQCEVA